MMRGKLYSRRPAAYDTISTTPPSTLDVPEWLENPVTSRCLRFKSIESTCSSSGSSTPLVATDSGSRLGISDEIEEKQISSSLTPTSSPSKGNSPRPKRPSVAAGGGRPNSATLPTSLQDSSPRKVISRDKIKKHRKTTIGLPTHSVSTSPKKPKRQSGITRHDSAKQSSSVSSSVGSQGTSTIFAWFDKRSLEQHLLDKAGFQSFSEFAREMNFISALDFLSEIEKLDKLNTSSKTDLTELLPLLIVNIHARFLLGNSAEFVSLPIVCLEEILKDIENENWRIDFYEKARKHVIYILDVRWWFEYKASNYWMQHILAQLPILYNPLDTLAYRKEADCTSGKLDYGTVKTLQEFLYVSGVYFSSGTSGIERKVNVFFTGSLAAGTKIALQRFLNLRGSLITANGKFGEDTHLAIRGWLISERLKTFVKPTGKWKESDCVLGLQEFLRRWQEKTKFKELLGDTGQINKIAERELELVCRIGQGVSSVVHRGTYQGRPVAVKKFDENSLAFRLEDFFREMTILNALDHPNILRFEGTCVALKRNNTSVFMLVTSLCEGGSIKSKLIETGVALDLSLTIKYCYQICSAMEYVHSVDVIHRDLKADNILIDEKGNAQVADLGLARTVDLNMTCMAGTPKWEAPEVLMGKNYSSPVDVYSFGMLFYEMTTAKEPFPEITSLLQLQQEVTLKGNRPTPPPNLPGILSTVMRSCWEIKPNNRPTMQELEQFFGKLCF